MQEQRNAREAGRQENNWEYRVPYSTSTHAGGDAASDQAQRRNDQRQARRGTNAYRSMRERTTLSYLVVVSARIYASRR